MRVPGSRGTPCPVPEALTPRCSMCPAGQKGGAWGEISRMGAQRRGWGIRSWWGSRIQPWFPKRVPRARRALSGRPAAGVFPTAVLCCPRVAEGVNAASGRQFWGPGARWGVEGCGWADNKRTQGRGAQPFSRASPTPAQPHQHAPTPRLSPSWGPLPGARLAFTRQHLLTLWASGPVSPPPGNPGARVLSAPTPLCGSSSCLPPPAITPWLSADCAILQQNSCQRQCLAYSRCSIMAFDPTAA